MIQELRVGTRRRSHTHKLHILFFSLDLRSMTFALENNNDSTLIAKYVNHSHRINNQVIPC